MTNGGAYPEYKETGLKWLGQVPASWGAVPLWTLYSRRKSTDFPDEELLSVYRDHGVVPKSSRGDNFNKPSEDLSAYQLVKPGDMVINKMKAWQGSVAISRHRGIVSPAYFVYERHHEMDDRYLHYLLRSERYITGYLSLSKGIRINQWDLDPTYHSRMPILVPSLHEQRAIVDLLDREIAQIDELIGKQEGLIELLAEKRQATITHAVTKGLDPAAPTKPSGIPWLGDIPAVWNVSKLRWKSRGIGDGLHGTPTYSDQGSIPFVNGTNLLGGEIRITDTTNFVEEDQLSDADLGLDESTVLISINGTIGNCAVLGNQQVMLGKSAAYIKSSDSLNVHFLAHYLRSHPTRSYFVETSGGTTIANLSLATLRGTPVPVPPLQMQEEIAMWLKEKIQSFDELGSKAHEAVRLLRERRSALISAAVTGKIDARKEPSQP